MGSNVETLRNAHEAFSAHNFDEATKLVAPTVTLVDHGRNQTFSTRDEFREWMTGFKSMASDMTIVDATYIDAGEWVTARFRAVGTQDGPTGPFPPTGKPFSLDVCEVWRFNANGEAIEAHNYSDGLGLLAQLGHLEQPA
jgi:hypothetical protein